MLIQSRNRKNTLCASKAFKNFKFWLRNNFSELFSNYLLTKDSIQNNFLDNFGKTNKFVKTISCSQTTYEYVKERKADFT